MQIMSSFSKHLCVVLFICQLIAERLIQSAIYEKKTKNDGLDVAETNREIILNLRRNLLKIIEEKKYHNMKLINSPELFHEFIHEFIDQDKISTLWLFKNEDGKELDSKKIEENTIKSLRIDRYFKDLIMEIFITDYKFDLKNTSTSFIEDFELNKPKYLLESIDEEAKIIYDEFVKLMIERKVEISEMDNIIRQIYDKHKINIEYDYLQFKIHVFLARKYYSETNLRIRGATLVLLDFFCKGKAFIRNFIIENEMSICLKLNREASLSKNYELNLQNTDIIQKMKNFQFALSVDYNLKLFDEFKLMCQNFQDIFISDKSFSKITSLGFDFNRIYISLIFLVATSKTISEFDQDINIIPENRIINIKLHIINVTVTIIKFYRKLFTDYVYSCIKIEIFKLESNHQSTYELSKEFTDIYTKFLFSMTCINIFDSILPKSIWDTCLISNINLLKLYCSVCSDDPINSEIELFKEMKSIYKEVQKKYLEENAHKWMKIFDNLHKKVENIFNISHEYDYMVKFLLTILSIRADLYNIFKFNLLTFKKKYPNYIQTHLIEEKNSIQKKWADIEKNDNKNDNKKNDIKNSEKIMEIYANKKQYSILFLVGLLSQGEKESLDIAEQYNRLKSHFLKLEKYKKEEFEELIRILTSFKIFITPQLESLNFYYSSAYKILIYDCMHDNLKKYENKTMEYFNIAYAKLNQKLSLGSNTSGIAPKQRKIDVEIHELKKTDTGFIFYELIFSKLIKQESELGFLNIFSEEDKIRIRCLFAITPFSDACLFLSIPWYMMFVNLQDLFEQSNQEENVIKNFQKTHRYVFVTEIHFYIEKWDFVLVLISDIEIKIQNSTRNKRRDANNTIKNNINIFKGKVLRNKNQRKWLIPKENQKIKRFFVIRNNDISDFDVFVSRINNILELF